LADLFDQVEGGRPFLFPDHIAQDAAQQADVFDQGLILVDAAGGTCRRAGGGADVGSAHGVGV